MERLPLPLAQILFFILLIGISGTPICNAIEKDKMYRLHIVTNVYEKYSDLKNSRNGLLVGARSKFHVIEELTDGYKVVFLNIYEVPCFRKIKYVDQKKIKSRAGAKKTTNKYIVNDRILDQTQPCAKDKKELKRASHGGQISHFESWTSTFVLPEREYFLPKETFLADEKFKTSLDKITNPTLKGPNAGVLIVPFKYRRNTGEIEGEAKVGVYAGYAMDVALSRYVGPSIIFVPFISVGLSSVSATTLDESGMEKESSETAVSLAGGLLIKNWDNFTLGFVVGEDRIGDKTWIHEGKTWMAASVGWKFEL